jgi:hypothetical protein
MFVTLIELSIVAIPGQGIHARWVVALRHIAAPGELFILESIPRAAVIP